MTWLKQQYWWNGVLFGTGKSAMGVMSYLSALVCMLLCHKTQMQM